MESQISISGQNIIQAFKIITNLSNNAQNISAANEYLNQCQKQAKFPYILINLYSSSTQPFIQLQSILLLLNIIKRNWQSKRGRGRADEIQSFQNQKPILRKQILNIYGLHNLIYVKHINQILKFLARNDYPSKYLQLHEFILSSLSNLLMVLKSQSILQQTQTIISLLSTVKIVIKQYSLKRLSHSNQLFTKYISQLIKVSFPISEQVHLLIQGILSNNNNNSIISVMNNQTNRLQLLQLLIQSSKKIDKIILYSLQCMPNTMQYIPQVQQIYQTILKNISKFDNFLTNVQSKSGISQYIQQYISGVLQQAFKTQSLYPFLLTQCLQGYLHIILNMLIRNIPNKKYKNQRLIIVIVQANLKIFSCFTYYMNQQQFSSSIYNRKQTNNTDLQKKLHLQFRNVFSKQNITKFLQSLITQVMVSRYINGQQKDIVDQQMILQQNQVASQDTLTQSNPYEICILLCKNIIKCFKNQVKPLLQSLFLSLSNFQSTNNNMEQKIIQNSMQLILILPKIYDEHELPLIHIFNLLQSLYNNHQYSMLARLIKNYHEYLNQQTLQNSFKILSQIVSTPLTNQYINVDIIYQSALTMKKILTQNQNQTFSFQNLSKCVVNLLSLLKDNKFTQTPTLMWPLIKLSNQLLKLTKQNIIIQNIGEQILDCIYILVQKKDNLQLTVCGLAQTLQNLLNIICSGFKNNFLQHQPTHIIINKSTVKVLYSAYTLIIQNLGNRNLQNVDNLYMLWLCLVRNYPTANQQHIYQLNTLKQMIQLNQQMKQLFTEVFDTVLIQDSICAIQILQEYVIINLISLNQTQLLSIFQKILVNCLQQHKVRSYTALFSLYYCYLIVDPDNYMNKLIPDIIKLLIQTLIYYYNQISPQINGLRTIMMIILNYCIIKYGVENMYNLLNSFNQGQSKKWFYVYCWSSQYVSNRVCHKINATSQLKAIQQLGPVTFGKLLQTQYQNQYPFDISLKTMILSLQPMKISQGYNTFSNMYKLILPTENASSSINSLTSRKIKLQLSAFIKQILLTDQRQKYKIYITQLFQAWDWAEDDIVQRFDKITSNQIINLLKGNFNHQQQDYNINQPD